MQTPEDFMPKRSNSQAQAQAQGGKMYPNQGGKMYPNSQTSHQQLATNNQHQLPTAKFKRKARGGKMYPN